MSALQQQINNARTLQQSYDALADSYQEIASTDTRRLYSANYIQNSDGQDTYTIVLPVTAKADGDVIIL